VVWQSCCNEKARQDYDESPRGRGRLREQAACRRIPQGWRKIVRDSLVNERDQRMDQGGPPCRPESPNPPRGRLNEFGDSPSTSGAAITAGGLADARWTHQRERSPRKQWFLGLPWSAADASERCL
jgi:hypothetical protein